MPDRCVYRNITGANIDAHHSQNFGLACIRRRPLQVPMPRRCRAQAVNASPVTIVPPHSCSGLLIVRKTRSITCATVMRKASACDGPLDQPSSWDRQQGCTGHGSKSFRICSGQPKIGPQSWRRIVLCKWRRRSPSEAAYSLLNFRVGFHFLLSGFVSGRVAICSQ